MRAEISPQTKEKKKSYGLSLRSHLFLILEPSSLDEPACLYPKINALVHIPGCPFSITPPLWYAVSMWMKNVIMPRKIKKIPCAHYNPVLHVLKNILGACQANTGFFFSFCHCLAIVFLMQKTMLHQQVQQQELCSFVSDTFSVSGAPGGAKDRSALSLTSCCLLTFTRAHYYIIVARCCSVPLSPHSRYKVRIVFGFV